MMAACNVWIASCRRLGRAPAARQLRPTRAGDDGGLQRLDGLVPQARACADSLQAQAFAELIDCHLSWPCDAWSRCRQPAATVTVWLLVKMSIAALPCSLLP